MPHRPHRLAPLLVALLLLAPMAAACSAVGGASSSPTSAPATTASDTPASLPAAPSGSATALPATPSPSGAISVDEAIARQAELDGRRVTIAAGFWTDGTLQLLSDRFMESYPPQVSRTQSITVEGTVPAAVLARLEHAAPGYAQVTWGQVIASGVLRAGSEHVPPILDLESISAE